MEAQNKTRAPHRDNQGLMDRRLFGMATATFFLSQGAPVPPNVSPDTPKGKAVQTKEGQGTWSLSMTLDRGCTTNPSLQIKAQNKTRAPHRDNRGLWTASYLVR